MNTEKFIAKFLDHWNLGTCYDFDEVYHRDFKFAMPGTSADLGLPEYEEWIEVMRTAYPDLNVSILEVVTEGDKIVLHWLFKGTNDGALRHSPASGRYVTLPGMTLFQLRDGKVAHARWYYDVIAVYKQLGRVPSFFARV